MSTFVSNHAVQRFRERFSDLCRNGPTDDAIRTAILACLASSTGKTTTTTSNSGDRIEHVRTQAPFAIRAIILAKGHDCEVLTVLPGQRSGGKGNVAAQQARRAARKAAEASCARSS